jgi:hypothetical protein
MSLVHLQAARSQHARTIAKNSGALCTWCGVRNNTLTVRYLFLRQSYRLGTLL